ncbi:hypothetical protein EVAR_59404_1 [Eumeta japonica]|uniref:SWIM-type domain-containing protein n=1 Tax=Eumeta variegata TaxID=151549 RepID=A0A4C1YHB1_EUMVA|nr:hypothetical protein EVAR_59404_1 [Eumeta japonica]
MYSIYIHREDDSVLRVQLRSRHTSSKTTIFGSKQSEATSHTNIQWYCQCKVGARVVGCCAHVASILWFWLTGATIQLTLKPSLEYARTKDAAVEGWSSSDSDKENEEEN